MNGPTIEELYAARLVMFALDDEEPVGRRGDWYAQMALDLTQRIRDLEAEGADVARRRQWALGARAGLRRVLR